MSYSISAFVERREKGSDGVWQMCGCGRLEWDCKDILLSEDGCVDDIDGDFCDVDIMEGLAMTKPFPEEQFCLTKTLTR